IEGDGGAARQRRWRNALGDVAGGGEVGLEADLLGRLEARLQVGALRLGERDPQAAVLPEVDRVAGALAELLEELDAVEAELEGEAVAVQVAGLPRRERRRPAGDRPPVPEDHPSSPLLRQVAGRAPPEPPTRNSDPVRRVGQLGNTSSSPGVTRP